MASTPMGPFCQSCGMPLLKPDDFGTTAEGWRQNDYCRYCFAEGKFLQPDATLEQMLEFVAKPMAVSTGMSENEARAAAGEFLPYLARWRKAA